MKHHRTHKRRHHSKRKTSRRVHKRRTHRRRGGFTSDPCSNIYSRLINMREDLNNQTVNSIEDFVGKVLSLYDEAVRNGCSTNLLNEIESFENGPVMERAEQLLGH